MLLTSFPPIISAHATVLVLGSMPGQRSLAQNQYYAHPQNQFWPLMAALCDVDLHLPYAERIAKLNCAGIALWDVLQHCEREGSLDARIVAATEVPNDFQDVLDQHTRLRALCFNGQKAQKAFMRHVKPLLKPATLERLDLLALPSTSPANANLTLSAKLNQWLAILRYLPDALQP